VIGNELVEQDLWVSSATGKIVRSQEVFYGENVVPDITIDLKGKIVAPGLIDVQLNGAFGFNFSQIPEDPSTYGKTLRQVNKRLIQTGVTSYLPTLTSEKIEVYHQVGHLSQIRIKIKSLIGMKRHSPSWAPRAHTASQKTDPNPSALTSKGLSSTLPKTESTK
jgi:N-acetylglucosamine-6-phosphate deacetylase